MANEVPEVLAKLESLQEQPLSIIRLSEPIFTPQSSTRTSDASNSTLDNPTPASLEADLSHYKVRIVIFVGTTGLMSTGTLLKTTILLSRTGNEREILASHCRRSSTYCRTSREH